MRSVASIFANPDIAGVVRQALYALLALMLLNLLSYFFQSAIYSVLVLVIFGVYLVGLSRHSPAAFVLLLTYIFFRFTTLLSGVAIEYGAEMPELDLWGEATGATIRLAMVYVIFITIAAVVIETWFAVISRNVSASGRELMKTHLWVPALFVCVLILSLAVLAIGSEVGFPMFTGLSRLAFREEVDSKLFLLYISNRTILVVLLGLVIATCSDLRRKISIACFVLILLVSLLFGEKFTSLITMLIFMLLPSLLLSKQLQSLKLTRLAIPLVLITTFTVPFILSVYGWSDDPVAAIERLTSRFAGQGQLWFVADRDMNSIFQFDLEALLHNLKSFATLNGTALSNQYPYFGAKYFMFNYMNDGLLFLFLETQALTLTFGFEPYILATNGWIGQLLPLALCAIVYALNLSYLMFGIFKGDPVSIIFAIKLFIWVNFSLQQGELWMMFGLKTLALVAICFVYEKLFSERRIMIL